MHQKKLSIPSYLRNYDHSLNVQANYKEFQKLGGKASFKSFKEELRLNSISEGLKKEKEESKFTENGNDGILDIKTKEITTIEDLVKFAKIDLEVWNIDRSIINSWQVASQVNGKFIKEPLFQVKVYLSKKIPDSQKVPVIQNLNLNYNIKVLEDAYKAPIKKTLVIGDAQVGFERSMKTGKLSNTFHDESAMGVILQVLKVDKFDEIVILGDMLDMTEASKYQQKPEFFNTLQPSINFLGAYLLEIRKLAPNAKIVFLQGNHEQRIINQIIDNFKFAYSLKAFNDETPIYSLEKLLDLKSINVELIDKYPGGTYWITDKLRVIHGDLINMEKELESSQTSFICGHIHKYRQFTRTFHNRDSIETLNGVSIGCLCKIDGTVPGVTSRPSWVQGFAIVHSIDNRSQISHFEINNGSIIYNSKLISNEGLNFEIY